MQHRRSLLQHPGKAAARPRAAGSRAGRHLLPAHSLPRSLPPLQWSLGLPWADTIAGFPGAVFGDDLLVAFTGLDGRQWELVGAAVAGPDAGRVLWTAQFPLGSQLPSTIAVAGELAVLELDGRVFAVDPRNGTVLWNATSPCSLGDPRMVDSRCVECQPACCRGGACSCVADRTWVVCWVWPRPLALARPARALPAALPAALPSQSLRSPCSEAFDFVYLVCNELSGDSTIIALKPEDGSPAWTLSTSSLASALVPVRAAAARDGMFYYSDTGSNITALRSEDGALLWRLDVAALVPSTLNGASVTHLLLTDDVLLIRWGATLAGVLGGGCTVGVGVHLPRNRQKPPFLGCPFEGSMLDPHTALSCLPTGSTRPASPSPPAPTPTWRCS